MSLVLAVASTKLINKKLVGPLAGQQSDLQ